MMGKLLSCTMGSVLGQGTVPSGDDFPVSSLLLDFLT